LTWEKVGMVSGLVRGFEVSRSYHKQKLFCTKLEASVGGVRVESQVLGRLRQKNHLSLCVPDAWST
jgi:hypothetical protein